MVISTDTALEHTPLSRIEGCIAPGFFYERFSCVETELDEGEYLIVVACKFKDVGVEVDYRIHV